jgi:hypothetical protein
MASFFALVSTGCSEMQPLINQTYSTATPKSSTVPQQNLKSIAISETPIASSKIKRTEVPSGIFTESFENGDDFYENFRFEDYMPTAFSSGILTKLTAYRAGSQRYRNEFEKNIAIQKAQNGNQIMKSKDKLLPDFLAFKVAFNISPKSYLFDRGGFYIKPTYAYLPFVDYKKLNHKSIADSNLVERPGGKDFDIYWAYAQERDYTGNNSGLDVARAKSKTYFKDFRFELNTGIKVGYFNEQTRGGSYSSRKSNEYSRVKVNQSQFSDILKNGYPVGDSIGSVFYMGYALVKVNKNSFACNDLSDRTQAGSAYVECTLSVDPVKYVINNFLNNSKYNINPEVIDLINDKPIFDRLK